MKRKTITLKINLVSVCFPFVRFPSLTHCHLVSLLIVLCCDKHVQARPFSWPPTLPREELCMRCKQLLNKLSPPSPIQLLFRKREITLSTSTRMRPFNNMRGNLANTNWWLCVVWSHSHDYVSFQDDYVKLKWCFLKELGDEKLRMTVFRCIEKSRWSESLCFLLRGQL